MKNFVEKHIPRITGTMACLDRTIFKGYLPISWAKSIERFVATHGLLIKDLKNPGASCGECARC